MNARAWVAFAAVSTLWGSPYLADALGPFAQIRSLKCVTEPPSPPSLQPAAQALPCST
jgi:hypothetical protein